MRMSDWSSDVCSSDLTWHVQSAVLWIATAFLAAGLFLAPVIHGGDPKHQKLGVDLLFWALILVVVGSFVGNYLSIAQAKPDGLGFCLGPQGYELLDLGRVWQIALLEGMLFWLVLMLICLRPPLRTGKGDRYRLSLPPHHYIPM